MPRGNYTIQRSCEECGKIFTPPTLVSKYLWGIERSGFFNGQGKWAKGFENQMV